MVMFYFWYLIAKYFCKKHSVFKKKERSYFDPKASENSFEKPQKSQILSKLPQYSKQSMTTSYCKRPLIYGQKVASFNKANFLLQGNWKCFHIHFKSSTITEKMVCQKIMKTVAVQVS